MKFFGELKLGMGSNQKFCRLIHACKDENENFLVSLYMEKWR
jgi:hypothetical protein